MYSDENHMEQNNDNDHAFVSVGLERKQKANAKHTFIYLHYQNIPNIFS